MNEMDANRIFQATAKVGGFLSGIKAILILQDKDYKDLHDLLVEVSIIESKTRDAFQESQKL